MSYCRWSSDDYQCDVYCYESSEGFQTHVATHRRVLAEPFPPHPEMTGPAVDDAWWDAFWKRHEVAREILKRSPLVPIGLPFDGESFTDGTAEECADRLEKLRAVGYKVPQYAIDTLREEAGAEAL